MIYKKQSHHSERDSTWVHRPFYVSFVMKSHLSSFSNVCKWSFILCKNEVKWFSQYSIVWFYQTFFFLIYLFFNWRIIALQNFVVFCQTSTWVSHRYTYIPSLLILPPISFPSHPSRLMQSPCLSFLSYTANSHWVSILHMVM